MADDGEQPLSRCLEPCEDAGGTPRALLADGARRQRGPGVKLEIGGKIERGGEVDDDELNVEDNLEEYAEFTDADVEYLKGEILRAHATGRAVVGSFGGTGLGDVAFIPGMALKHPKGIRGVEEWYVSTVIRREFVHELFRRETDIALRNLAKLNAAAGQYVDVVFTCGTDFGTQTGTFCSPETFRELYMPYYKKVNNWIHENTNWKTF